MVQDPAPGRWRDRYRDERRREFLDTAREILNTDGHQALTMQRVTRTIGCSEGSIYTYFATKDALINELQVEALQVLTASFLRGHGTVTARLAEASPDADLRALAQAMATARFWVASEATLPQEIELSRRVFAEPYTIGEDPEQVSRVLPPTLQLLETGRQTLDEAVEQGVLRAGNNVERSLLIISSMTGALLTSKLGGWDTQLFDGRRLADELSTTLFAGWGAPEALLPRAHEELVKIADLDIAPRPD